MIKVSKLADYAVIILSVMAMEDNKIMNAQDVSRASRLPEPTVSKVLKMLSRADVLNSVRGVNGGYTLARSVQDIQMSQIIAAVDGPVALTACVETSKSTCDFSAQCGMKGRWDMVNTAILAALESVSLHDMMSSPKPYKMAPSKKKFQPLSELTE